MTISEELQGMLDNDNLAFTREERCAINLAMVTAKQYEARYGWSPIRNVAYSAPQPEYVVRNFPGSFPYIATQFGDGHWETDDGTEVKPTEWYNFPPERKK